MKMSLKYYSAIFAIAGIAVLYFMSVLSQPAIIDLIELPNYENKQVTVEGFVTKYYATQYGSQMITIKDDNASAIVFIEETIDVEYGDKIRTTGKVQKYDEDWEIVVNNKRLIETIQKWENISIPIWQLAQNPTKYDGLNINVTGIVDSIHEEYLYLSDADGEYTLITFYNPYNYDLLYPGQTIYAAGKFDFDQETFRYTLTLFEENHNISQTLGD